MSSLTYFFVLDLPPINHGYIIFNGCPAVLVSVAGCHSIFGVEQDTSKNRKIILFGFKTEKNKILVGKEGFEPPKA